MFFRVKDFFLSTILQPIWHEKNPNPNLHLHTQNQMSHNKAIAERLASTDQMPMNQMPFFWAHFPHVSFTIHNQSFLLSIDHDRAGAGAGEETEFSGIGYTSRSWVHTGSCFPEAELQNVNELLIHVPVDSDVLAENAWSWA